MFPLRKPAAELESFMSFCGEKWELKECLLHCFHSITVVNFSALKWYKNNKNCFLWNFPLNDRIYQFIQFHQPQDFHLEALRERCNQDMRCVKSLKLNGIYVSQWGKITFLHHYFLNLKTISVSIIFVICHSSVQSKSGSVTGLALPNGR